jgi:cytochrome P450
MRDLATPVPARMIVHWLGLDDTRREEFVAVVRTLLHSAADMDKVTPAAATIGNGSRKPCGTRPRTDTGTTAPSPGSCSALR